MRHEFTPGTPRPEGAGRKPGTPNKATAEAKRLAEARGIDPFDILLSFADGDGRALGLPTTEAEDGTLTYARVPLNMRLDAAKAAVQYLLPKRKSVEVEDVTPGSDFMSLPDEVRHARLKALAARVLGPIAAVSEE